MESCRDFRRASISSVGGFPRRRQRVTTLRDSTDEDRQMQLQETVRLRDRERLQKKEKDREFPKRRRVDRSAVQPRSGGSGEGYGDMESTDWCDEDHHEEAEETKNHQNKGMNQLSPTPSSLSNNRIGLHTLRSCPAIKFPADELFGVPVPRRARSVSGKRLQKCWTSGIGGFGEDFSYRRFSPAPMNLNRSGGGSPFSLGASLKKRMNLTESRTQVLSSASDIKPSIVQDDIEIEVAEALFDLMKQSQSQSPSSQIQEKVDSDSKETADGELKRLKPERREGENNAFSVENEQSKEASAATIAIDSTKDLKIENGVEKEKFLDDPASELVGRYGFVNKGTRGSLKESVSPSCVKVDACDIQDPTVTKAEHGSAVAVAMHETKLDIDLMASPPVASSPERDTLVNREIHSKVTNGTVDKKSETISGDGARGVAIRPQKENDAGVLGNTNQLPDHDVDKCRNGFFSIGSCTIQQPEQKNQSTSLFPFPFGMSSWPGVLPDPQNMPLPQTALPINGSPRPSMTMRLPQFKFSHPLPKRCATHRYIAHSIDSHMQLINKSLSSEPTDAVTSCGLKSNPMLLPTTKFTPGNLSSDLQVGQNLGSGNDEPPPGQANNLSHFQGFMFPLGHHLPLTTVTANSSGPLQSATALSSASLTVTSAGKPPLLGGATAVSYGHQILPSNGINPYMTILNNGYPVSMSTSTAMPTFRGGSPAVPFFNSSFYQPPVFNVHNQNQLLLPASSSSYNVGSSSHKQLQCPQQRAGDNKFPPLSWPACSSGKCDAEFVSRKNGAVVGDGLVSHSVKPTNTHNGSFPVQPRNLSAVEGGGVGNRRGDHHPQQAFALSFGSGSNPGVNLAQTLGMYRMLPAGHEELK